MGLIQYYHITCQPVNRAICVFLLLCQISYLVQEQVTKFLTKKTLENIDAGRQYMIAFFSDMLATAVFQV